MNATTDVNLYYVDDGYVCISQLVFWAMHLQFIWYIIILRVQYNVVCLESAVNCSLMQ